MKAADLIKQGRLNDAVKAAEDDVRNNPAAAKPRLLLAQLLAVAGFWDRAVTQFEVAGKLDPANLLTAQVCRHLVICEGFRADVFAGKRAPLLLGEPDAWVALMIQALAHTAKGEHRAAASLREQALDQAPARGGTIAGQRFEWLADADSRLGPILEVMVDARYYWVPMSRIASIKVEAPADLRDLVWIPASFVWTTGAAQEGFIPARYPGTDKSADDQAKFSRRTDWTDLDGGSTFAGSGQRMLTSDAGDHPILETASLIFDPAPTAAPTEGS